MLSGMKYWHLVIAIAGLFLTGTAEAKVLIYSGAGTDLDTRTANGVIPVRFYLIIDPDNTQGVVVLYYSHGGKKYHEYTNTITGFNIPFQLPNAKNLYTFGGTDQVTNGYFSSLFAHGPSANVTYTTNNGTPVPYSASKIIVGAYRISAVSILGGRYQELNYSGVFNQSWTVAENLGSKTLAQARDDLFAHVAALGFVN